VVPGGVCGAKKQEKSENDKHIKKKKNEGANK
jgi:hypothetical protein